MMIIKETQILERPVLLAREGDLDVPLVLVRHHAGVPVEGVEVLPAGFQTDLHLHALLVADGALVQVVFQLVPVSGG